MNKNFNINSTVPLKLLTFFLAVSIVLRCSPTILYQKTTFEYGVIIICVLFSLVFFKFHKPYFFEFFILCTPLLCLSNFTLDKYFFYMVVGIYYYFCIQGNNESFGAIKIPILVFAGFTAIITWYSYLKPSMYMSKILPMLPNKTLLISQFKYQHMYMGFTNHYSRNAFFIILAIMILVSEILSKNKKHIYLKILYILFLSVTELLVAKRGPLMFMILSILIIVFLKELDIIKGIGKFSKCIIGIVAFVVLAILFIPGANNIVLRVVNGFQSDNITSGRSYLYPIAWDMFKDHPLFGAGWNSFYLKMSTYSTFQGVHNDYLQYLAETGIIGFIVVIISNIGCLVYTLKGFVKVRTQEYSGTKLQIWSVFSLLFQIFFLLYSFTGIPHFSYEQYAMYIMSCGYGVSVYRMTLKSERSINIC